MKGKSFVWWGGLFATVLAAQAGAQESKAVNSSGVELAAVHSLAPLRVQGERLQTELPPGTTVTTRQQMEERSIQSWEDFSKRGEPGVNVNQQNNSINIRGMDGDRIVTRVDGIRVPWLDDGARSAEGGLNTIAFNSLSAIDLVRSSGSVESGSLVGYLNLRTLQPGDLLAPGQDFGALLKTGYDSADESFGADAALAGRISDNTRWLVQAGQRKGHERDNKGEVGGYGSLRERPDPMDYTQNNALIKLEHDLTAEHSVNISGEVFRRENTTDDKREQNTTNYAIGQYNSSKDQERDRVVVGYGYQALQERSVVNYGDVKLYWQKVNLEDSMSGFRSGRTARGPYGRTNTIEESTVGLVTTWGGYVDGLVKQHWSAGGEWAGNDTKQLSQGYDSCGSTGCSHLRSNQADMPKVKGNTWSLWAQDEFSWNDGKYALTPALRFDAYEQKPQAGGMYESNLIAREVSKNSESQLSPSLLATYKPAEKLSFYAKYGYGFKAPNTSQLYLTFGGKSPGEYVVLGNPGLKPEVSRGWELGMDVGDTERGARLSLFDTRYKDFIDRITYGTADAARDPAWDESGYGTVHYYTNRSRVRIYGAELSGHWAFNDSWYSWGSVAWANGKDQDRDTHLNSVAPLKAIMALGYRSSQWGAEGILTMAQRRSKVEYPEATSSQANPDFKAPGYGLVDLTAWWKPVAVKGVRLQAGVYNVFDKKYWNALDVPTPGTSGFSQPIDSYTQAGRSVRVQLTYQY